MLRKSLIALALVASLGGCATLGTLTTVATATVSAQQVALAGSTWDALENTGAQYLSLPLCTGNAATPLCRTASASKTVYADLKAGQSARNQLEAQVNASGTGTASVYNALITTIQAIQAVLPSKG